MSNDKKQKLIYAASMVIYGTIGTFKKFILLPAGLIACLRGVIGFLFLSLFMLVTRHKPDFQGIRRNWWQLILSGMFIGINWIFLFESFNRTSVAITTVCLYMGPVYALIAAPIFLKSRLSVKQILCVFVALIGILLVSGVIYGGVSASDLEGIIFGLIAALFYAGVMIVSKKTGAMDPITMTASQMAVIALTVLPYVLFTVDFSTLQPDSRSLIFMLIIGIVHSGLAYILYLGSMRQIPTDSAAILSYIDPILAVILSVVVLHEPLRLIEWIGIVFVIGAMIISELKLPGRKTKPV